MPHSISLTCPKCQKEACFNFARAVKIEEKKDIDAFKNNKHLQYILSTGPYGHGKIHYGVFWPGLSIQSHTAIFKLPDGYDADMWKPSKNLIFSSNVEDYGVIICSCGLRRKHSLQWPHDAFYKVDYRSKMLWAFDREIAFELRNYILSTNRNVENHKWQGFLMKVPKLFLSANARKPIVGKLNKLLMSC